jgi:hypothetical protein
MSSTPTPRVERIPLRRALMLITLASVAATVLIVGLLWVQMVNGNDPALGPKIAAAPRTQSPPKTAPTPIVAGRVGLGEGEEAGEDGLGFVAPAPPLQPVAPAPAPAPVQTQTS